MSEMQPHELQAYVAQLQEASTNVSATKAKIRASKKTTKKKSKPSVDSLIDDLI